jgi:5S rRNA maturation endonuclease (ribonuclease M5)
MGLTMTTINFNIRNQILSELVCQNIEKLFSELKIKTFRQGNMYVGACPIHAGSNNPLALNLYPSGDRVKGYWRCNTHHCQNVFFPTILGFTRGVLSHHNKNWEDISDPNHKSKMVGFREVIDFCCNIVGQKYENIKIDEAAVEKLNFVRECQQNNYCPVPEKRVSRDLIRNTLQLPAKFFLDQGFSAEILDKYDVGLYLNAKSTCVGRVVAPIYDDQYQFVVGCTARAVNEYQLKRGKWISPPGFEIHKYLYNYWFSRYNIQKSRVAVIVEGPKDVWRLEESGIHNSVAVLGSELSAAQQNYFERCGVMSLVVLTDNDKAGRNCLQQIQEKYRRYYNIYDLKYDGEDIGSLSIGYIRGNLTPQIINIEEGYKIK